MNMHVADSRLRLIGVCDNSFSSFVHINPTPIFTVYNRRLVFSAVSLSAQDICVASQYPGVRYSGAKAATFQFN